MYRGMIQQWWFFVENTFFESLTKEQKQKYTSYSVSSFEYAKYIETHTLYNDVMPMFSYLVDAILYERYAKYLLGEIEQIELTEVQTDRSRSSILTNDEPCEQKKQSSLVKKPIRFNLILQTSKLRFFPLVSTKSNYSRPTYLPRYSKTFTFVN